MELRFGKIVIALALSIEILLILVQIKAWFFPLNEDGDIGRLILILSLIEFIGEVDGVEVVGALWKIRVFAFVELGRIGIL